MKIKTLILATLATISCAHASTVASVTFDGSDTTFLFTDVTGNVAGLDTVGGDGINDFFFLNLTPTTAPFTFNNTDAPPITITDSSTLSVNTVSSAISWIGSGAGSVALNALDGIQLRFGSDGTYTGNLQFTIAGQNYSALDGETFETNAASAIFGGTFGNVVPEPTSSALLGLGALGLLARRKRG